MIGPFHRLCGAVLMVMVLLGSCREQPAVKPAPPSSPSIAAPASAPAPIDVYWASAATCSDALINQFVRHAVQLCVAGDYDEYRLLWRYDQQPPGRRTFQRLWSAVQRLEIRRVQPIAFRHADGRIDEQPHPLFVFHAYIDFRPEAAQSDGRLQDRDMVLLIVKTPEGPYFLPAPDLVRQQLLGPAATQPASSPTTD
ncbi:MAG: hypothetical protein HJJLKODD_01591 [Phycisphaerae bacterium]|nr:hypothetical protein [Phycisphaerae bacterium]